MKFRLAAVGLLAVLAVAGCGKKEEQASDQSASAPAASNTATTAPATTNTATTAPAARDPGRQHRQDRATAT